MLDLVDPKITQVQYDLNSREMETARIRGRAMRYHTTIFNQTIPQTPDHQSHKAEPKSLRTLAESIRTRALRRNRASGTNA